MTCCGQEVGTPFCPLCGKKVREQDPLRELLRQVRLTQRAQETLAENHSETAKSRPAESRWPRHAASARKAAAKWKSWGDALEASLVARDTKGGTGP